MMHTFEWNLNLNFTSHVHLSVYNIISGILENKTID